MRFDTRHTLVVNGFEIIVSGNLKSLGLVGIELGSVAAADREHYGGVALLSGIAGGIECEQQSSCTEFGQAPAGAKRPVGGEVYAVEALDKEGCTVQLLLRGRHILLCKGLLDGNGEGVSPAVNHCAIGNLVQGIVAAFKAVVINLGRVHRDGKGVHVHVLRELFLTVFQGLGRELQQLQLRALVHRVLAPRKGVGRSHRGC